ncbi:MAG: UDP-N-acetylglucosamine 2-epimerase (non-hydrolyzing) [Gemmatimonadetes bacterium]|nr:MAG: UDP-N-acetylglucosamine 2-epimerase (non-hydrolyzing) [Gemmatimonadota bacterium]
MKVVTVLGTRPEIIRLSCIIPKLDCSCQHVLVHTGQNYAEVLSDVFFHELEVRAPDHSLGVRGDTFGEQIGKILIEVEKLLLRERPDRVLVLGDTNSGLAAVIAKRMGIPVFHLEAGNRCYDDRVPEEVNRRIIDHSSSVLMPYTHRSAANLVREGIDRSRVFVVGNPIFEVLEAHRDAIARSDVLVRLGLSPQSYFIVTMHRAENVDIEERLRNLVTALRQLAAQFGHPVVCSLHPRTRSKMEAFGIANDGRDVRFIEPVGFFDFVALERQALCALSDSGTVQEECCLFRVPNVTIRDVTERPETIEAGSNMLTGMDPERIVGCVETVLAQPPAWTPPAEYLEPNVSSKVVKIVLGYEWREE